MALPAGAGDRLLGLVRAGELSKDEAWQIALTLDDGQTGVRQPSSDEVERRLAERWTYVESLTLEDLDSGQT